LNKFFSKNFLFAKCRKAWLILLITFSGVTAPSQTSFVSGIINTYHSVIEVLPSGAAVRVDNAAGLAYGDFVLLIQMKGASISTTNNSTFGDTTSLNQAGNYELATICAVKSDTVYFFHDLLNSYSVPGKIQLVKFGDYISANVVDTVKAQSWNSTTGKGGVLAIRAQEDLTLNAPLFADSTGFKGGSFYLHSGACSFINPVGSGYAYDATTATAANGAYKGEGVADVPSNLDGARGAPANGGGGGNNHNNGGGGGSNLTTGGNGGANFSTGPTGCTGTYPGRGGKAMGNWANTKIFAGGGGGAGHANSTVQPYAGGNGGGIVLIIAKNIIGNGYRVTANGQNGRSTAYDGASGGGGGGTILMNITNNYSGLLTVQANGGNGGNEDDDLSVGRCYGAGGGGSGGVIYFNGSTPAITSTVAGGLAGINIDPNACAAPAPASGGTAGLQFQNYTVRASVTPSNDCPGALPLVLTNFHASLVDFKNVILQWEVANPELAVSFTVQRWNPLREWESLGIINASAVQSKYQLTDLFPVIGENIYRLLLYGKDNQLTVSANKKITLGSSPGFTVFPNPARNKIVVAGTFVAGDKIRLTDLNGRLIKENVVPARSQVFPFMLPDLPAGVYMIQIQNLTKKVIIN
jgi:hypothetical protein